MRAIDPFADVQTATREHLARHGCGAYTYSDGSLPGAIAGATRAARIVEVGTALGYTALWLAYGAPDARVETIEFDPDHVRLAREQLAGHPEGDRVTVLEGEAAEVLGGLDADAYDLAFFDGFSPSLDLVAALRTRLRTGGVLLCANLNHGGAADAAAEVADPERWLTHDLGESAICVKR